MTTTTYEQQAEAFLTKHHLKFTICKAKPQTAPLWIDKDDPRGNPNHGIKYQVSIWHPSRPTLRFPFWGSIHDKEKGITPNAYDVLACISGDTNTPDAFKDFCSEYGYDEDSRKAEATWKRCLEFSRLLQHFFTKEELSELKEIQ